MNGFSIIMPTFRRPHTIHRAIKTVTNQTFDDWELIVIDNDGDNYKFDDERIKYVPYPDKRGAHHARNHGISLATREIITFLDDDDMLHPSYLAKFSFLFKNQITKMARCLMRLRGTDILSLATPQVVTRKKYIKPEWISYPRHDQIYFTKILDDNEWSLASPHVGLINEILCFAMHSSTGGLRDMEGKF